MEMPPDVLVPACIEKGTVYHFEMEIANRDGSAYVGRRFFIVLNAKPKTDEIIILSTITKQIGNVEAYLFRIGESKDTAVRISRKDFSALSVDSIVNCNSVYSSTRSEIIARLKRPGGKVFFEKIPKSVMDAIVSGVMKSGQIEQGYKKMLI